MSRGAVASLLRPSGRREVRHPPGPGALGPRGLSAVRRDATGFLLATARRYGDVAYFRAGAFRVYLLSHPDLVREVLVSGHRSFRKGQGLQEARRILGEGLLTSEQEVHRSQRRLIQPVFQPARIESYGDAMVELAERTGERWREGAPVDVHAEMLRLTLSVVARTLFGADLAEGAARRVGRALADALEMFSRLTVPFQQLLWRLPLPSNRRFWQARRTLDDIVYGMIGERRVTGEDRDDLLSMLMAAEDEDGGRRMDDRQLRDEAMTIFLAGHETTANALTWTWYLLSQHPSVESRLHAELAEVVGEGRPSSGDASRLPYARMVVAEAMRLYPPSWAMARRCVEDREVGGYLLPAGYSAVLSQYVVHHDPRWFPDPFRFDPERWTPDARAARPKHSYFPFGAGPRACIGEGFAWMEALLVLATLAPRWRLRLAPAHPVALLPGITLRPRYGMRMVPIRR